MATITKPQSSNGHSAGAYEDVQLPPHDQDAEAALLGSILIHPERFPELDLDPVAFFRTFHRLVYEGFQHLTEQKQPIDFVTVSSYLLSRGVEEDVALIDLLTVVPTSSNLMGYAKIVKELHNRRRLISLAGRMATNAYDLEETLDSTVAGALEEVRKVGGDAATGEPVSSYTVCEEVMDTLTERRENPKKVQESLLSTGFLDLDRLLEGLEPGSLVICAARPGMGKSILEQNIRMNVAKEGKLVVAFNLEMSNEQLMMRALSSRMKVAYKQITRPAQLATHHWELFHKALGEFSTLRMYIDDTPSLGIDQFNAKAHRLAAQHGHIDLLTVDYLQLMTGRGDRRAKNRVQEIGEISRGLKQTARELDTVVWANAQVSRAVEGRIVKKPTLSDLRESGDMEQDADVVMFIYRDEYYNPETPRANIAEIDVPKNRNGGIGQIDLYFNGKNMMFRNLTRAPIDL
jgi:replicative DNA helicase